MPLRLTVTKASFIPHRSLACIAGTPLELNLAEDWTKVSVTTDRSCLRWHAGSYGTHDKTRCALLRPLPHFALIFRWHHQHNAPTSGTEDKARTGLVTPACSLLPACCCISVLETSQTRHSPCLDANSTVPMM